MALASSAAVGAAPADRWRPEIAEASARFAIPGEWVRRVMLAESGGRTFVGGHPTVSRSGAMGLMQLMPQTWREVRARLGLGSDPFDPHDNIMAGAAYLRSMYDRFGYPGLFAAYNAGPGLYSEFLAGNRPLPTETRAYVAGLARRVSEAESAGKPPPILFAVRSAGDSGAVPSGQSDPRPGLFVKLGPASSH